MNRSNNNVNTHLPYAFPLVFKKIIAGSYIYLERQPKKLTNCLAIEIPVPISFLAAVLLVFEQNCHGLLPIP